MIDENSFQSIIKKGNNKETMLCYWQDAYPKGEIFLGSKSEGYSVRDGLVSKTTTTTEDGYGITIITPER